MAAIQYTDRGTAVRLSPTARLLTRGVLAALEAPSILNTQPWRWRIDHDRAELHAERNRQLHAIDPEGRLLVLSCGVALHHARVALAADGVAVEEIRFPDDRDRDLLATMRYVGTVEAVPEVQRLRRAITLRRTDRRPFADLPVPDDALDRLREAAELVGAHLHIVRPEDVAEVAVAAGHAPDLEQSDSREELAVVVHPANGSGDGVPPETTAAAGARPVPIRHFTGQGEVRVDSGVDVSDRFARYVVIVTDGDLPQDWLTAGEALSAVLLTATVQGLASSPMSDLVEVIAARATLRHMLGNVGCPAIVVRVGVAGRHGALPESTPAAIRANSDGCRRSGAFSLRSFSRS